MEEGRGRKGQHLPAVSNHHFHLSGWAGHHGEQVQRFLSPLHPDEIPPRSKVAMETGAII